jgi:hypothetical protein
MVHCWEALPSQPAMTTGVPSAPSLVLTHLLVWYPETIGPAGAGDAGVIAIMVGSAPVGMRGPAVLVAKVIGVTVPEFSLVT